MIIFKKEKNDNAHCTLDASKKANIKASRVATEISGLEFYPDCNQQRILRIDFNKTPQK